MPETSAGPASGGRRAVEYRSAVELYRGRSLARYRGGTPGGLPGGFCGPRISRTAAGWSLLESAFSARGGALDYRIRSWEWRCHAESRLSLESVSAACGWVQVKIFAEAPFALHSRAGEESADRGLHHQSHTDAEGGSAGLRILRSRIDASDSGSSVFFRGLLGRFRRDGTAGAADASWGENVYVKIPITNTRRMSPRP